MEKAFASSLTAGPFVRKAAARTALIDLNDSSRSLLADCFRQFGVETVVMSSNAPERMHKEKVAACVLRLGDGAEAVLEAARSSPSNGRCIVYALGGNALEAMKYSKYGINAMFHEPLERPAALKLIRSTHLLVLHEFRRYVRVPVMTDVAILGNNDQRFPATSVEISSGGMSLQGSENLQIGSSVEVSFALMHMPRIGVRSTVSWRKGRSFGVRFDAADDRRLRVKRWIDSYLGT